MSRWTKGRAFPLALCALTWLALSAATVRGATHAVPFTSAALGNRRAAAVGG